MWGHNRYNSFKGPFLFESDVISTRFQYIGDKQHNCSLKIHQVEHNDTGTHTFRFITNSKKGQWTGKRGSTLKVVDLNVLVTKPNGNGTTKDGDSVSLTCINGCDGGNLSSVLTWFKNGEPINEGPVLYLSNMSFTNSGNYTCSLKTHSGTTSAVITIDVEYGPENTSVSVRPSMEVDAGINITLICSSYANPPVQNYTWFKIDDDDIIAVGHQPVLFSGDGGQYLCSATNKHGSQNSSVVTLKMKPYWATFTRDVLIVPTVAVLLIGTTIIAFRRLNKKKTWAPKTDCEEDKQNADYVNWLICDNNQSQEGNQCEGGTTELIYATVYFNNKKSNIREQQMDSHKDEDVIYSTVCRNLTRTLMLLFLAGALCSQWKVEYQQQRICAVKGSSVVIPCLFYYPDNLSVKKVMWGHNRYNSFKGPFLFESDVISTRFQYIGDKQHNCSLKIHQVEHNDTGTHTFRFITNSKKGQWTGKRGSTLKVVDLNVLVTKPNGNGTTKDGDSVSLTCINGCDGGNLSSVLTWFKNGEPINEGPVLYLSNMSFTNSGNYTCSLKTHSGTTSAVITIDVEYGPENTSVSVRPSMEVDAGINITLICSSYANPPVQNYTWFKIDDDDIIAVGHRPVLFSGDGGQYLCSATNKHGSQNSSVVTLKMKQYWATFIKDVLIIATVAVLLIVSTLIAVRRLNKKRTRAPESDCEEDIQNADYVNWPVFDNDQSQEGNQSEETTVEVIYATVDFRTKRKPNMEQQMDSNNDDESVIYSTVCRYQVLNPSYIEPP
ncbi:basement membrane-specific heparan sulfate proteoglycan core protein-like [Siniperca chuatsi]|uniref:basement membrane-specific heparan sulfate proteoglycan core protein-like n=1 Tax=Siniperca chuatsi TaxID=119488 RepID=UPI001CE15063|nr:basement membrane-specific heparan sulfate proteoglycan core protein-like [Siniperca chuatsi]